MEVRERNRLLPLALYTGGLLLMFLGERVFSAISPARLTLSLLGFALSVAYFALRLKGSTGDSGERRSIERVLAIFAGLSVLGLILAFSTTEAGERLLGIAKASSEAREKFESVATITWVALLAVTSLPIFFAERALLPMTRAENVEGRRVLSAEVAGLTLALAATYGALFTYAAGELDLKADFSYFRTSRPSESTKNVVKGLPEPVKVSIFFPPLNDVGREVASYLKELGRGTPQFAYEVHDRLLEPTLAKDFKVNQDGIVIVGRGALQEIMNVGVDMEAARPKLKTFDTDFQKTLLKVSRSARVAYLTTGHGEINEGGDPEGRTASGVRKLFESQNYSVKDLGLAQGLGNEIPKDATIVVVLGPARPFLPGEVAALKKYADTGGHLFLALDPDAKLDLEPLASIVGLTFEPVVLANENNNVRRRYNESDRTILVSNRYSSHASISTLSRNASRAHVVFPGAGALDKAPGADSSLQTDFVIKSLSDTFADKNGDFRYQESEKRTTFNLAAAVTKWVEPHPAQMRAFVMGDADAVSDAVFGNEANVVLFIDAIRWLGGEESFMGAIATTEDVKIEHTKQKDLVLFYGTIFAVPALVLGLSLLYSRRARTKGPKRAEAPLPAPTAAEGKGA
jgi:hypothetical protein